MKGKEEPDAPFVSGAVPVPVPLSEDHTPLPMRMPLFERPPPPPFLDGKPVALPTRPKLPLHALSKLRLLRADDLASPDLHRVQPTQSHFAEHTTPHIEPKPQLPKPNLQPPQPTSHDDDLQKPAGHFVWQKLLPPSGSLSAVSAAQILGWAIATGYSGGVWLCPQEPTQAREVFFEAGELIGAQSSTRDDALWELLGPHLTTAQKKRAEEVLKKAGRASTRQQLDLLLSAKLIDRKDFCQRQVDCVVEIVVRAVGCFSGQYRLLDKTLETAERPMQPVLSRLLLAWAIRKTLPLSMLQQAVGDLSARLLPQSQGALSGGGFALLNLGLSQKEEEALMQFDGDRSLKSIAATTGLGEHALYALAYTLLSLGALAHPFTLSPDEKLRLAANRKARAQARVQGEIMSAIQHKARQCECADYFTVLGVSTTASLDELRAAYLRERARYAPTSLPQRNRSALEKELQLIAMVLDEAFAVLGDPVRRACYTPFLPASQKQ
ncbi:MAG TPA: hypothetical protein PKE31_13935 [Pseudomonadota bacterium]|nr:hypothetical protein [Pseudomonadota bacterium]